MMNKNINDQTSIEQKEVSKEIDMDKVIKEEKTKMEDSIKVSYNLNKDDSSFFSKINKKVLIIFDDLITNGKDEMEGVLKFDHKKGSFYIDSNEDNVYLFTLKNYKIHLIT